MVKPYTELQKKTGGVGMESLRFNPKVLDRYQEGDGPWKLNCGVPGATDNVTFYTWQTIEGQEEPVKLTVLHYSEGRESAEGLLLVLVRDLAALPDSEQEHWKKYQEEK